MIDIPLWLVLTLAGTKLAGGLYGAYRGQRALAPKPFEPYPWWPEVYAPLADVLRSSMAEQLAESRRQLAASLAARGILRSGVGAALQTGLTKAAQRQLARELARLQSQAALQTAREYGTWQEREYRKQMERAQLWQGLLGGLAQGPSLWPMLFMGGGGG